MIMVWWAKPRRRPVSSCLARLGVARYGVTWRGLVCNGTVMPGPVSVGKVELGVSRFGVLGLATSGPLRSSMSRQGASWYCEVRFAAAGRRWASVRSGLVSRGLSWLGLLCWALLGFGSVRSFLARCAMLSRGWVRSGWVSWSLVRQALVFHGRVSLAKLLHGPAWLGLAFRGTLVCRHGVVRYGRVQLGLVFRRWGVVWPAPVSQGCVWSGVSWHAIASQCGAGFVLPWYRKVRSFLVCFAKVSLCGDGEVRHGHHSNLNAHRGHGVLSAQTNRQSASQTMRGSDASRRKIPSNQHRES